MEAIAARILPAGVSMNGRPVLSRKLAGNSTWFIFALALLLVYRLAGQYESWITPAAVLLAVPLALLGTVGALLGLGVANNLYVQIGLVLLIALSAKNAILIIEMARQGRAAGKSMVEATVEACQIRFRPILMTSFTLSLACPACLFCQRRRRQRTQSLGLAVATGMLASTCLAVLFVPAFYVMLQRWAERKRGSAPVVAGKSLTVRD
jgi:HAE1 family hydrophobic/amphiphilic exporter-1